MELLAAKTAKRDWCVSIRRVGQISVGLLLVKLVGSCIVFLSCSCRQYIEDITRRCEDMNFIFEW